MDKLFKPFLESLYDYDPNTMSAIIEAYDTIFEGFDYVKEARRFANNVIAAMMDVTESDFVNSYAGDRNEVNKMLSMLGKTFVLNTPEITSQMPNGTPLFIFFTHPRTKGSYRKVEAGMIPNLNRPMFMFFQGNPHKQTPEELYQVFMNTVSEQTQTITHELVHLYDKMTKGKVILNNKYPLSKTNKVYDSIRNTNDELLKDPEHAKDITPDTIRYMNSPAEVNARLVSAVDAAIAEGHTSSWDDFYAHVMNNPQIKPTKIKNTNQTMFSDENYKKIVRNLHKVYSNLMEL